MYKMTIDEREMLAGMIAELEAEIQTAKADGTHTECWMDKMTERLDLLQERLSDAEIVEVQDLGRPHYSELLSTDQVKTPSEYQELAASIQRLPRLAARTRARGSRWEEHAARIEAQISIRERKLSECVIVPVSLIKRDYCETYYDTESGAVVVEVHAAN